MDCGDMWGLWIPRGQIIIVHLYALCLALLIPAHLSQKPLFARLAGSLIAITVIIQAFLTWLIFVSTGCTGTAYIYLLTVVISGLGLTVWKLKHFIYLSLVAVPLSLILCLSALLGDHVPASVPENLSHCFTVIHVGTIFCALTAITVGFCAAVIFLLSEREIKAKAPITDRRKTLPSLLTMDKVNYWTTVIGFPLFSVGLFGGFVGTVIAKNTVFVGDIKEIISVVIWIGYGILFQKRLFHGWHGHIPAVVTIWIFGLSVLSLTLVNLFMTTTHRM